MGRAPADEGVGEAGHLRPPPRTPVPARRPPGCGCPARSAGAPCCSPRSWPRPSRGPAREWRSVRCAAARGPRVRTIAPVNGGAACPSLSSRSMPACRTADADRVGTTAAEHLPDAWRPPGIAPDLRPVQRVPGPRLRREALGGRTLAAPIPHTWLVSPMHLYIRRKVAPGRAGLEDPASLPRSGAVFTFSAPRCATRRR
jgi:hypothetical protein